MAESQLESLLAAISVDAPCGPDLEYDPDFQAMLDAGAGKPERQYGDKVYPAEPPDWSLIHEQAMQLATRTRDLRVAVWLARSTARLHGLGGAVDGLRLVQGLVERHWEHLHPPLDASDNNDPTARVMALTALVDPVAGLGDLRAASLTGKRGALTVRDIELALGPADLMPGESVPTEDGVLQGVATSLADASELGPAMQAGYEVAQALAASLERHLEASQAPDLVPLKKVLQRVADAGRKAVGDTSAGEDSARTPAPTARAAGTINSRDDANRALERVCEWIERNEPSNPAPLLIRRAQRLMSKSFIDIIRDLAPDGLKEVEKLAGIENT
jgi:type VI secretion system protein ImpA